MSWIDDWVAECQLRFVSLPDSHDARTYLTSRGVRPEQVATYRLGWVENPLVKTCTPTFWEWAKANAWNKLVFPLTDPFGAVIGVQLRSPYERGYRDFLAAPTEVCPPTFGLHVALPAAFQSQRLVLVEGVFDYFAVVEHAPETLAILTSATSLAVRRLISRYARTVVWMGDMDAPGRRGGYVLAGLQVPEQYRRDKDKGQPQRTGRVPPYQVLLPFYSEHDPSDLWKAGKHGELAKIAHLGLAQLGLPGPRHVNTGSS